MSFRYTELGNLFQTNREAAIREIAEALELADGRVQVAAHYLVICRRYLYKILWRYSLWELVDDARRRAVERKRAERERLRFRPVQENDTDVRAQ